MTYTIRFTVNEEERDDPHFNEKLNDDIIRINEACETLGISMTDEYESSIKANMITQQLWSEIKNDMKVTLSVSVLEKEEEPDIEYLKPMRHVFTIGIYTKEIIHSIVQRGYCICNRCGSLFVPIGERVYTIYDPGNFTIANTVCYRCVIEMRGVLPQPGVE